MIVFGWVSFAIGSAILAWAGFIGVDAGSSGPRVVNFGGLTLGAAIMVSGAVIGSVGILGETIVSSINKIALARSQNSKSDIIEKSPARSSRNTSKAGPAQAFLQSNDSDFEKEINGKTIIKKGDLFQIKGRAQLYDSVEEAIKYIKD